MISSSLAIQFRFMGVENSNQPLELKVLELKVGIKLLRSQASG